jgi:hypothetical protein
MSLYLDVVCTEAKLTSYERQEKSVHVIGEILPYVLAKYGVANQLPAKSVLQCPSDLRPSDLRPSNSRENAVRRIDF